MTAEWARIKPGRRVRSTCGGEEEGIIVVEEGIGVGYWRSLLPNFAGDAWGRRFIGRGRAGEEDKGSNAGSRVGAGRLTPATGETGKGTCCGEEGISLVFMHEREGDEALVIVGAGMRACGLKGFIHDQLRELGRCSMSKRSVIGRRLLKICSGGEVEREGL